MLFTKLKLISATTFLLAAAATGAAALVPPEKLAATGSAGFAAATTDGAIHFINKTIDPSKLKALITRNGAEIGEISDVSEAIQVPD